MPGLSLSTGGVDPYAGGRRGEMKVHRLQSPFKHWLSGLLSEVAVFVAYMLAIGILVALLVQIL
jgi:hypothetical protein